MYTDHIKPVITLRLKEQDIFFGPGVVQLLTAIEGAGSVRLGATAMGLSYSKAWKILRTAEGGLGVPLVHRNQGGAQGGGSTLTPLGLALLQQFKAYQIAVNQAASALLPQYFPPNTPLDDQWALTQLQKESEV